MTQASSNWSHCLDFAIRVRGCCVRSLYMMVTHVLGVARWCVCVCVFMLSYARLFACNHTQKWLQTCQQKRRLIDSYHIYDIFMHCFKSTQPHRSCDCGWVGLLCEAPTRLHTDTSQECPAWCLHCPLLTISPGTSRLVLGHEFPCTPTQSPLMCKPETQWG